ncbi:methylenetetrahydrofolate reductase (NADPH) [Neorhizobium galegae]|uniref:methylenetetrahydrofolate reductase n=1 Tax=Neorhizobium galegae TaxID=399 RepID=UPI001FD97A19|nr:methylenetetrahydrofolate reductase [Neorhizobium galegae]MBP2547964.1 methylenetetrahydrofolate reductase (NADPH) [Neorhizobium galegae]
MDMHINQQDGAGSEGQSRAPQLLDHWSIEVMPRTAAKIADFRALLPHGTRIYIAHIDGTPAEDMVATARRLNREGFPVMPHIPARSLSNRAELEDLLLRYRHEADVRQALLLAGGNSSPRGNLTSSLDLIETSLFDAMGFTDLHVAGHPEGNRDIDSDGSTAGIDAALLAKQAYGERTDARIAITTQFAFDAASVIAWAERIAALGVTLPIHVGIAGPAKIQTLIKYAISCGVGPSLKILQKRALDVTRLLVPYEPTDLVAALDRYKRDNPQSLIERIHMFPLGGIEQAANWCRRESRS